MRLLRDDIIETRNLVVPMYIVRKREVVVRGVRYMIYEGQTDEMNATISVGGCCGPDVTCTMCDVFDRTGQLIDPRH